MNFFVDKEKCVKCGLCVNDCSVKALNFDKDGYPQVAPNGEKRCFKCQHCLAICPTGALSVCTKNPENSSPVRNGVNPDDLLNLIQSRRSFRSYKQENVDAETMQKLKDMLKYTPTGCNNHGLHFAIIDDIEVMNNFRNRINKKILDAISNKIIKSVARKFGRFLNAFEQGEDVLFRTAPHMVIVSVPKNAPCKDVDPTIALSYFELYAQSLGLGTCWCGLVFWALNLLPELLGQFEIPNTHKVGYVMLFGKPQHQYSRTVQPEEVPIVSVKDGDELKLSLIEKIKRMF